MLTRDQQIRAVRAITAALSAGPVKFCAADVAEERARNLVTALTYPVDASERHSIVAGVLLTRTHEIRSFWCAVETADLVFELACLSDDMQRFQTLLARGWNAEKAAALMTLHGWANSTNEKAMCA